MHNARTLLTEGASSRGVLVVEQAGDGTGQQVLDPAAGARQFRASDWGGARGRGSHPRTRAASGLRPGTQRSPARSWLTAASTPQKARPDAVVRTPQQSAERRARARVMGLGDLRRSG